MPPKKLLVINPNTSKLMTASLDNLIRTLSADFPTSTQVSTYTAPSGPSSINNFSDALESARIVYEDLRPRLEDYDAHLVACYSVHPLVAGLQDEVPHGIHVTGIFEASIVVALSLLPMTYADPKLERLETRQKFGIVSTGKVWEEELMDGVKRFLDASEVGRFKGVETTGLTAAELHSAPKEVVSLKMKEAVKRLVRDRDVKVVCLGCAGMVGMEDIVRKGLVEELGVYDAEGIHILDGVKVGIGLLEGLMRTLPRKR